MIKRVLGLIRDLAMKVVGNTASEADVQRFLEKLSALAAGSTPSEPEEDVIARSIFDWQSEFVVSRAPGRLDVMGGIADYSGSLVLQMPIAEAAHVALQPVGRETPSPAKASKGAPLLQLVSFGASLGGRSPTFSMPLAELYAGPDGAPTPLAELRARFSGDVGAAWAAYPVGVLGVLLLEGESDPTLKQKLRALTHPESSRGLSIIIGSDVPEGKGVSSSAAVEVRAWIRNQLVVVRSWGEMAGGVRWLVG
jgi:L-arabinokinase